MTEPDPVDDNMTNIVQCITSDGEIIKDVVIDLSESELIKAYQVMILTRTLDTKMVALQRQGRIGFYLPSYGEEACSVGSALGASSNDWFFPAYREQGAMLQKGVSLNFIISHLRGSAEDEHKGRSLPGLFGSSAKRFVSPSAPVGTQIIHAVGTAFASKLLEDKVATIAYFGDGATSSNDFHSGLNFAGVYKTPTVFFCKNNQWAISTNISDQTASDGIAIKSKAYGFDGIVVDGNDILAVYTATKSAMEKARSGKGPTLIEARTYRLSSHSTSDDGSRYQDQTEYKEWVSKDPIARFRRYLENSGIWNRDFEQEIQQKAERQINEAITHAESSPMPSMDTLITDVYSEVPKSLRDDFNDLKNSKN